MTEAQEQGFRTCRVLLLLLACLGLVGCGADATATATPIRIEVPVEVPVEVTRLVTQQVTQQIVTEATPSPAVPCADPYPNDGAFVTIGAILPLSSPGALLAGFAMQTALNIAATDINEQGGVRGLPVRLVTYDSAGTPERSSQFAERLILLDCAVGIVGLYHNGDAMAVSDVAHHYGIPVIIAEAGADELTARRYPEVFRIAPAYSMLAEIPAAWMGEIGDYNGDGTLAATMIIDNAYSTSALISTTMSNLITSGVATELLPVGLPSTDFSSVVARLVAHETLPDVIFIYIKGDAALLLQNDLLNAGIGPKRSTLIVQNYAGLNSARFWSEVPEGTGTIVSRMGAWTSTLTERGQDFAVKYDQYASRWPESYAFASYDALWLLADAMQVAPSWTGSDLVATLEATNEEFTSGHITFSFSSLSTNSGDQPQYLWHQWADSQVLYLQYTEENQPADAMSVIWPPHYRSTGVQTAVVPATP